MATPAAVDPKVINGNTSAQRCRDQLKSLVASFKEKGYKDIPTLAVVLVGTRKDSQTYVNMKTKACNEVGITPQQYDLDEKTTQDELLTLIHKLNADPAVNGILVQLPVPAHINQDVIIAAIDPAKDADGLTKTNAGDVVSRGLDASLISCTPLGVMELLSQYKVPISGKHAVVIGRSVLVGRPLALLLLSQNATVTICHSRTPAHDLPNIVRSADIVIAAVGKAEFVKGSWIKPGAVVIDVGINAVDDATKKSGYRLVGDVEYAAAKENASLITPVPGGVGPMTVAMLLRNTVIAYLAQHKLPEHDFSK